MKVDNSLVSREIQSAPRGEDGFLDTIDSSKDDIQNNIDSATQDMVSTQETQTDLDNIDSSDDYILNLEDLVEIETFFMPPRVGEIIIDDQGPTRKFATFDPSLMTVLTEDQFRAKLNRAKFEAAAIIAAIGISTGLGVCFNIDDWTGTSLIGLPLLVAFIAAPIGIMHFMHRRDCLTHLGQ